MGQVQSTIERLGLFASRPVATTLVQGSERQYENGWTGGEDAEAAKLCLALRSQLDYMPQLQALPWAFTQKSTRKQQQDSLNLHAEKKALAVLVECGEAELKVAIEFNACMDCREFFKKSSRLLRRGIQLHQPRM